MVGYTPQVVTSVWFGNKKQPAPIYGNYRNGRGKAHGYDVYGREEPGYIWQAYMDSYLNGDESGRTPVCADPYPEGMSQLHRLCDQNGRPRLSVGIRLRQYSRLATGIPASRRSSADCQVPSGRSPWAQKKVTNPMNPRPTYHQSVNTIAAAMPRANVKQAITRCHRIMVSVRLIVVDALSR
jgi:membrane peptidoglycan carboxypeptidase